MGGKWEESGQLTLRALGIALRRGLMVGSFGDDGLSAVRVIEGVDLQLWEGPHRGSEERRTGELRLVHVCPFELQV